MDFVRSYLDTNADLEKKWGQKCSTGQSFICIKVTFNKIQTLDHNSIFGSEKKVVLFNLCSKYSS